MALLLTISSAQSILSRVFPSPTPSITCITELPDTFFNSIYILTLRPLTSAHPQKVVLKVSPPPEVRLLRTDTHLSASESTLLRLLGDATSVPIPLLLDHDASCTILDTPYTLLSHLPGLTLPNLSYASHTSLHHQAGALYRQIATLKPPHGAFGRCPPTAPRYTSWRAAWTVFFESLLHDGEDMLLFLPYAELRAAVGRWAFALDDESVGDPRLCIIDFTPTQGVLAQERQGEGQALGLIDFERGVWGDPEFARAFRRGGGEGREKFLEGYFGDAEAVDWGGLLQGGDWKRGCRWLLYEVYHCVVIIVAGYYYGLHKESEMDERKRLVGVLEELVAFRDE